MEQNEHLNRNYHLVTEVTATVKTFQIIMVSSSKFKIFLQGLQLSSILIIKYSIEYFNDLPSNRIKHRITPCCRNVLTIGVSKTTLSLFIATGVSLQSVLLDKTFHVVSI